MKFIGNVLWFFTFGCISAALWFLAGIIWCVTLIGIPFGKQCFKIAKFNMWPMGKAVDTYFGASFIGNLLWYVIGGFIASLIYWILGLVLRITIVLYPFGKQFQKLSKITRAPFASYII